MRLVYFGWTDGNVSCVTTDGITIRDARAGLGTPIDDLSIDIPTPIPYSSTVNTLRPADVIAAGTPGGVGNHCKPQLFAEPGLSVDVEIGKASVPSSGVLDEAA